MSSLKLAVCKYDVSSKNFLVEFYVIVLLLFNNILSMCAKIINTNIIKYSINWWFYWKQNVGYYKTLY